MDAQLTQALFAGNPKALAKAKYNVEKHFVVVGLLEYMNESVTVFENKLPSEYSLSII